MAWTETIDGCGCCNCCGTLTIEPFTYYDNDPESDYLDVDSISNWYWLDEEGIPRGVEMYVNNLSRLSGIPLTIPKTDQLPQTIVATVLNDVTYRIDCGLVTLTANTNIYFDLVNGVYQMRFLPVCSSGDE